MTAHVDVHANIGGVPYREVPHPEPAILARVLARENVRGAWVGELSSAFGADPHAAHDGLFAALAPHPELRAVPAIHPGLRGWDSALESARERGAAAVRAYPAQWRLDPKGEPMRALAERCGERGIPIVLTVHLEPQGAPHFTGDGDPAILALTDAHAAVNIVVLGAERTQIERVRAALAPAADVRVWWDISGIAGPPADDLAGLLRKHGGAQFLYGSGWPLRLTQVPRANLELLPADLGAVALADADAVGAPRSRRD